jgi:hypothetical protein
MYQYKFEKLEFGKWKLTIPALPDGSCAIKHGSIVKVIQKWLILSSLTHFSYKDSPLSTQLKLKTAKLLKEFLHGLVT